MPLSLESDQNYCKFVAVYCIVATMVEPSTAFKATLQANACSLTKTRQLVFAALLDQEPQTMHEITAACAGQVDRASVYRTVALFEHLGIVQRLQIGWKYKLELTDDFHHHHHHLTCRQCNQTVALSVDEVLEQRLRQLARQYNFQMQGHQLEIQGRCQNCQKT
jgi:Fur family transcriptional regulator, ferric uptake regulator